jgi:glycosyltransferase involved in cell wall biosynthesis
MAVSVLHVCDKFGVAGSSIHGVSRLFSWWFPRYDAARFTVGLVGLKGPEPASRLLADAGISVQHLGRGKFDPRIATDLADLVQRRGVDILHVHGYAAADFGRLAARATGAALVLHEHFADPRMPAYQGLADRVLAPLVDRAIAVSASTRDFLVRERHVPAEKVALIWNGAPLDEFAPVPEETGRRVRAELGIPTDAIVVGSVGRLSAQKGHRVLLEAAGPVLAGSSRAWIVIAGDGDQMPVLRAQAARLGADARRVVFAGHRADVPAVLGAIDVFCISSHYEGTPLALFEAMAAGKAIVSTAVDGCREVLQDGLDGLLVPPSDPPALATALSRAVDDAQLRVRLAHEARASSKRYDIAECVRRMQDLYDDVLARRAARRPR